MLLPGFYKILNIHSTNNQLKVVIQLNAAHEVFKGHFPNNPVTPGVCMLQIFKELTEQTTNKTLFIKECTNVKFMAIINPEINSDLKIVIDFTDASSAIKIKASASFDETTALKVSAVLSEQL